MRKFAIATLVTAAALIGIQPASAQDKDKDQYPKPTRVETPSSNQIAQAEKPGSDSKSDEVVEKGDGKWTTIKGKIVLDGATEIPKMKKITPDKDKEACLAKGEFAEEDMIVDPKTRAIKNVFVWIEPAANTRGAAFPKDLIHPKLVKPLTPTVTIDQPCCKFEPHVLAAQEGQDFIIKNSAPIPHNAKYDTENNGSGNPLIPSKGEYEIKGLKAEKLPINLSCSIHPYMKAWIRVYDHPYFAVTDEKGNFEIKLAPQGDFKMYIWQENGGWNGGREGAKGKVITIKGDTMDMKEIKYKPAK